MGEIKTKFGNIHYERPTVPKSFNEVYQEVRLKFWKEYINRKYGTDSEYYKTPIYISTDGVYYEENNLRQLTTDQSGAGAYKDPAPGDSKHGTP